jgi:hypothetical protein
MTQNDAIDIAELRSLTDRLFQILEEDGVRSIPVTHMQYWTVFPDAAFTSEEAPEVIIGNVGCDLTDFRNELRGEPGLAMIPWHAFLHLAGLMKFIAFTDLQGGLSPSATGGA